jgi:hypothetical protein
MSTEQSGPEFTPIEISKLESLATWNRYYMRAYEFVHSYHRGAEYYKDMSEKQTLWLWRLKGEIEAMVKKHG